MIEKTAVKIVPPDFNYSSQYVNVLGSNMHYVEQGVGDPILLLHGIPTSCYIWRNIIPFLAPLGRCIALDLIGMGKSDVPDITYSIEDHIRYVDEFIAAKKLKNVTIIMHGWGSLIGFDYAMRNPNNCKGLAFYEAFLRPLQGNDLSLAFQEQLILLKDTEQDATIIDKILPQSMLRHLTAEEMQHYREPFLNRSNARKVLEQYWQELPRGDGVGKIDRLISHYSQQLTLSPLPKLLLFSIPGFVTTVATLMWAKENLPHLELCDLGEELHFAQEGCPELMGETISAWLQAVEL